MGAALAGACDVGAPPHVTVGPAPHLVYVRVSIVAADGTTSPGIIQDGATAVATTTRIDLKFDRYMLPTDVIRQAVCLRSAPGTVKTANDCTAGVFLQPTYDPVSRVATFYQDATQGALAAGQLYTLTVLPGSGPTGFQAFDGIALDQRYEFSFTTAAPAAGTPVESASTANGYCLGTDCGDACAGGAAAVFQGVCATCHAQNLQTVPTPPTPPQMISAPEGLYLDSQGGLLQTAIGKVAHTSQEGGAAQNPANHAARFGVGMPIVNPNDPGESYMLYKILASSSFPLDPADPSDAIAPGEAERLRLTVVTGVPMPAKSTSAIDYASTEKISAWIAAGAQFPSCTP